MRKQKTLLPYLEKLKKLQRSGLDNSPEINRTLSDINSISTIEKRIEYLFQIINSHKRSIINMLFFVMYDIESNKVRYNVAKYLERKGCTRIQRSIFLADLPKNEYDEIKRDLTEVQALYDNHDSIIVCPISTDQLKAMKIIGQHIAIDIITHSKNTLFF